MKPAVPVAKLVEIPNATSTWPFKAFVRWPDIWVGLNPDGTDALGLATCFGGWDDPQDDGSTASGTNTKRNRIEAVSFAMDGLDFSALSKEEHAALDGAPIPRLLTPRGHTAFGLPVEVTVDGFVRPFLVPAGNIDLGPGRGSMKPGAPAHIIDFTPFLARRFVKGMTPEIAELARSFEVKCKYRIVGAAPLLLWKFPDLKTQSLGVAA